MRGGETLARRFHQTEANHGYEFAKEELGGKATLARKGSKVDFDQVKCLYEQCNDSLPDQKTTEGSRKAYISALAKMLDCTKVSYLEDINPDTLYQSWKSAYPTQVEDTYYTEIRKCNALFKAKAFCFYKRRGFSIVNPFADVELPKLNIRRYIPMQRAPYSKIVACEGLSSSQAMIV